MRYFIFNLRLVAWLSWKRFILSKVKTLGLCLPAFFIYKKSTWYKECKSYMWNNTVWWRHDRVRGLKWNEDFSQAFPKPQVTVKLCLWIPGLLVTNIPISKYIHIPLSLFEGFFIWDVNHCWGSVKAKPIWCVRRPY